MNSLLVLPYSSDLSEELLLQGFPTFVIAVSAELLLRLLPFIYLLLYSQFHSVTYSRVTRDVASFRGLAHQPFLSLKTFLHQPLCLLSLHTIALFVPSRHQALLLYALHTIAPFCCAAFRTRVGPAPCVTLIVSEILVRLDCRWDACTAM